MLNRALKAETELSNLYVRWSQHGDTGMYTTAMDCSEEHRFAARELVRLIVANRGVPEDNVENLFGATRLVATVAPYMPYQMRDRVYLKTATRSEESVTKLLERIEKIAPLREKVVLQSIRERLIKAQQKTATLLGSRLKLS